MPVIICRILFLVLLLLLLFSNGKLVAQNMNTPFYDLKPVHFGVFFGTDAAHFRYELSEDFYATDSVQRINMVRYPGIQFGAISNFRLGEHFDLRFTPTLILAQRGIEYTLNDTTPRSLKEIESVMVEAPLSIKFKSTRHRNIRYYILAGVKYGYDISSDAGSARNINKPEIYVYPHNYYYEYGFGLDLYFPYFKFSPELKLSRGLVNVLEPDRSIISRSFDKLFSQFWFISLLFE
ncbi:MAG: outer membrane beta-barrel protein [Bacteroidia bacterium]